MKRLRLIAILIMTALVLSLIPVTPVAAQGQITLTVPVNGEQNVDPQYIYFSWQQTNATEYDIFISQSPAFDIIDVSSTVSGSWYESTGQLAYDTTYYWMVQSNLGEVSDNWSFTTMVEPIITITSPNGGEIWPVGSNQTITWQYNSLPVGAASCDFRVYVSFFGIISFETYPTDWHYIGSVNDITAENGTADLDWLIDPALYDYIQPTLNGAIYVECLLGNEMYVASDYSDAVFTIGDIPAVTLNPTEGCSVVTVSGEGFYYLWGISIEVYWDGVKVPACPPLDFLYLEASEGEGFSFTTMITVPTQNAPGVHSVSVNTTMEGGTVQSLSTTFTVTSMTGAQGAQGLPGPAGPAGFSPAGIKGDKGDPGDQGAQGPAGVAGPQGISGLQGPASAITPTEPEGTVAAVKLIAGPSGPAGPQGSSGIPGSITGIGIAALVLGIACVIMVLFGLVKKFVFK